MNDSDSPLPFFPIPYEVEEGKIYYWCSCGKSSTPPLCDKEYCGQQAVAYRAILTETVYFCGCKETQDPPFCDGSHARLLRDYVKKRKADEI